MRTVFIALDKRGGQSWHISRISSADTARVLASPGVRSRPASIKTTACPRVENRIHGGGSITNPSVLPSIPDIKELLSLLEGFDVENVPPACIPWMRTRIVFPEHQSANGAANTIRTDDDVAAMSCLIRAVMESVP